MRRRTRAGSGSSGTSCPRPPRTASGDALARAPVHLVLGRPDHPSFFVALVNRERYVEANSKLSASRSASFVAGPAVGGFLIQAFTAPVAVLVDAVSFVASAVLIARVKAVRATVGETTSLLADARAGLRYVLGHRYLRAGLGCVTTVNF